MPGAELLTSLHERYMNCLCESTYAAQTLGEKILREYPKYLCSCKLTNKQGIVIYNASIRKETAIRRAQMDDQSIKEAAMYLRSKILSMSSEQKELPRPLTTEAVMKGKVKYHNHFLLSSELCTLGQAASHQMKRLRD